MIFSSYNVRGLCNGPKVFALKRIIDINHVDILLLQETMIGAHNACEFFLRMNPGWRVSTLDVDGLLGGTLVVWNPFVVDMNIFSTCAGIWLSERFGPYDQYYEYIWSL